jgi:hypothetical protein
MDGIAQLGLKKAHLIVSEASAERGPHDRDRKQVHHFCLHNIALTPLPYRLRVGT